MKSHEFLADFLAEISIFQHFPMVVPWFSPRPQSYEPRFVAGRSWRPMPIDPGRDASVSTWSRDTEIRPAVTTMGMVGRGWKMVEPWKRGRCLVNFWGVFHGLKMSEVFLFMCFFGMCFFCDFHMASYGFNGRIICNFNGRLMFDEWS